MLPSLIPRRPIATAALLLVAPLAPCVAEELDAGFPGAPVPKVEIDVSPGLVDDLLGVTDGALAGVAAALDAFGEAGDSAEREAAEMTVEQIAAVKHVVGLAKDAVQGVQLRVYDGMDQDLAAAMFAHYEDQFDGSDWERVVRARDDGKQAQIALLRGDGAVRGVLVVACESSEAVTVRVECDLSPEKARELTNTIAGTALRLGLAEELEELVEEIREEVEEEIERR